MGARLCINVSSSAGTASACILVLLMSWAPEASAQTESEGKAGSERRGDGAVPRGPGGAIVRPAEREKAPEAVEIVMPRLVHFEGVAYPEEARRAQVEGSVVLELDIDVEGKVTRAGVIEAAGHGFDEAAQAAALKFRFEPATRDGKPFAARIKYLYRFELKEEEAPEVPEAVALGNLEGRIFIDSEEAPFANVAVTVESPTGERRVVRTDAEGRFRLEGVSPGKYTVRAVVEGFQPLEVSEEVVAGEITDATYRLSPVTDDGGFEIVVRGERAPREVTRRTIERREMARIPGTSGDALRSLQSLPGVARPPGLAGLLIVRGSAPQDTQIFVDGTGVPLIYHFGGLSSAVPTELLDRIDFYPGNFSARYGRVMGSVVDVALRAPNTECYEDYGKPTGKDGCFHGLAQVDLIDTRFLFQGPIAKGWSFAVAGRRSWIDTWLEPALEAGGSSVTSAPVYYDYQAIVNAELGGDSELSMRFFGSDDRLELIITDPAAQDPGIAGGNIRFGTRFYRAQALYRNRMSSAVELKSMLSAGFAGVDFSLAQIRVNLETYPIDFRNELGFSLAEGIKLNVGQDVLIAPYDVLVRAPTPPRPGEPNPGPFSTRQLFETADRGTLYRPAWYAEAELKPTPRVLLVPGVRLDYTRDTNRTDLAPRFSGRYDLIGGAAEGQEDERRRRTTVKGGVGVFYQPPQFQETDAVFGSPNLGSNRAVHYSVGMEQELTKQIEVSVEGYYKDLDRIVSRVESGGGQFAYGNDGTGYMVGAETLVKYKPDPRFFGWFAYTLSRSVRTDRPGDESRLFEFDQTHNLTALGSYRLGRGWEFGARFRVVSGVLTTPVLQPPALTALYVADAAAYAPLTGRPFSQRLPLFHQLDLRIDKSWQFRHSRFSVFLDVQNAYNNPAVEAVAYNFNFTASANQTGLPIIPSLGVRGEF